MSVEPRISVIGLGKLGACMAGAFAAKGFETVGVDVSTTTVDLVNQGLPPVTEPGLGQLMKNAKGNLRATDDYDDAITNSEASFLIVPTDSNPDGAFSIKLLQEAARHIGSALANKAEYHLVVVTSTVLPGCCEHGIVAILEEASAKKCGTDFGVCYSPEFIALGSVIHDFLNPDFALVGEWDPGSGDRLAAIYCGLFENDAPIARMSIPNAELCKLSLNAYLTTKITFANMIAEICEKIPGGDVDAVTGALGLDERIGAKYLKGALGYGGTCFPRDNAAFAYLTDYLQIGSELPRTIDKMNRRHAGRVARLVLDKLGSGGCAAVLGLSFKPDTPVVVESQSLELARLLAERGVKVSVYDPIAMDAARAELGDAVTYSSSVADCVADADVVVVATPWRDFERLPLSEDASTTVIDGWRILANPGPDYLAIGREIDAIENANNLAEMVDAIVQRG